MITYYNIISMDILLEALDNFNDELYIKNEHIQNDETITEEERECRLDEIVVLIEKIDAFSDEIKSNIDNGITNLTVYKRNRYFEQYYLDDDAISSIKIIMRRIKNRHYQHNTRFRKDEINGIKRRKYKPRN